MGDQTKCFLCNEMDAFMFWIIYFSRSFCSESSISVRCISELLVLVNQALWCKFCVVSELWMLFISDLFQKPLHISLGFSCLPEQSRSFLSNSDSTAQHSTAREQQETVTDSVSKRQWQLVAAKGSGSKRQWMRENHRISMRIDLEVLTSFDFIITTSTSDSECLTVSVGLWVCKEAWDSERQW